LALMLAQRGINVAISARSADKLAALAAENPRLHAYPLDVTDRAASQEVAQCITAAHGPIDLAVFNAGTWDPMGASDFDAERIARAMDVNFNGVVNGLEAVLPGMIARHDGHVALVASVAGYRGLPKAAAYAPSKAALISLAEVLKPDLARDGVAISIINPGFVETPMTSVNTFPMPFIIKADRAAEIILRGLDAGKFEIAFPWQMQLMMKTLRILPYPLFFRIADRMQPLSNRKI
jgi:short-subunit dehydrogenase